MDMDWSPDDWSDTRHARQSSSHPSCASHPRALPLRKSEHRCPLPDRYTEAECPVSPAASTRPSAKHSSTQLPEIRSAQVDSTSDQKNVSDADSDTDTDSDTDNGRVPARVESNSAGTRDHHVTQDISDFPRSSETSLAPDAHEDRCLGNAETHVTAADISMCHVDDKALGTDPRDGGPLVSVSADTPDSDSGSASGSHDPRSPSEANTAEDGISVTSNTAEDGISGTSKTNSSCRKKGQPYFPNYMNGVELCLVCGDVSTGFHYRTMTCEGCKGFFRRTNQKKLQYQCKFNKNCVVDKNTRNQCQDCRYRKCIQVGMAKDLVLDDKQRLAKRLLIEKNREMRQLQQARRSRTDSSDTPHGHDDLTPADRQFIDHVLAAFSALSSTEESEEASRAGESFGLGESDRVSHKLGALLPAVRDVISFAKNLPGFSSLTVGDQTIMVRNCCLELLILQAAGRYNSVAKTLTLRSGDIKHLCQVFIPVEVRTHFQNFAEKLAGLDLDQTEVALLAAVLVMQSDWTGLEEVDAIDRLQDDLLTAFRRYLSNKRPDQPLHWPRLLMMVTHIRDIRTRHWDQSLHEPLDEDGDAISSLCFLFS